MRLISPRRPIETFYFFFDRIHFVPELTDEIFAYLLCFAISSNRVDILEFLIGQDFTIINRHDLFFHFNSENVQAIQNLLLGHAEKAVAIAPTCRSLQECFNAEQAYVLIGLASSLNPAGFHPTDLLRGLARNPNIEDEDMAGLIEHLCKIGAAVEQQTFGLLEQSHPGQNYAKSLETLHYYEEYQKVDIKEPATE
jgi:hypothetical protein